MRIWGKLYPTSDIVVIKPITRLDEVRVDTNAGKIVLDDIKDIAPPQVPQSDKSARKFLDRIVFLFDPRCSLKMHTSPNQRAQSGDRTYKISLGDVLADSHNGD
jgi:hypothetical protein